MQTIAMEYVALSNIPLLGVGDGVVETTRDAIVRLCTPFGEVGDVVISREGRVACVGFYDPTSAQEALLKLKNAEFHGGVISASVAPPPRTFLPGYIATSRPSRTFLVEQESYLRVRVKAKRLRGIVSVTSVRYNACLVVTETAEDGLTARRLLAAHPNRAGKPVSTIFLRKG